MKQYNAANGGMKTMYVKNSKINNSQVGVVYYIDIANDLLVFQNSSLKAISITMYAISNKVKNADNISFYILLLFKKLHIDLIYIK